MYCDDTAIVLNAVRYDDTSLIAHLYTRSAGMQTFLVGRAGSRKPSRSGTAALLEPLNVLSMQWDQRPRATMFRMKDVRRTEVWKTLPYVPEKRAVVMLMAECLGAMLREGPSDTSLFDQLVGALRWLDAAERGYGNFHLVLLLDVARALGVAPDASTFITGRSFDIVSGQWVPLAASTPMTLAPYDAEALFRLSQTDFPSMVRIPLNRSDRARLLSYLNRFLSYHLPAFPLLKSPDILAALFE